MANEEIHVRNVGSVCMPHEPSTTPRTPQHNVESLVALLDYWIAHKRVFNDDLLCARDLATRLKEFIDTLDA